MAGRMMARQTAVRYIEHKSNSRTMRRHRRPAESLRGAHSSYDGVGCGVVHAGGPSDSAADVARRACWGSRPARGG